MLTGDDVDLGLFPIQTLLAARSGSVHHASRGDHEGPITGVRNVGMYRMQKIDRRSTYMHWQIHKDGRADLLAAPDGRIPLAVALGLDPVTAYAASAPLPSSTISAFAGTSRSTVLHLTSCTAEPFRKPATISSPMCFGSGALAE